MANGLYALAPNRLGNHFSNRGMESLTSNRGYGVERFRPKRKEDEENKPVNRLRVAKAREFGKKKEEVF